MVDSKAKTTTTRTNRMFNLNQIIATLRLAAQAAPDKVHAFAERLVTIPQRDRDKLYAAVGLPPRDRETADVLYRKVADAQSDWLVFVASNGTIEAD
jgi:hypothetical protein